MNIYNVNRHSEGGGDNTYVVDLLVWCLNEEEALSIGEHVSGFAKNDLTVELWEDDTADKYAILHPNTSGYVNVIGYMSSPIHDFYEYAKSQPFIVFRYNKIDRLLGNM